MKVIINTLKKTFTDLKKLLIGFVLSVPFPFIAPLLQIIVLGYVLKCGETAFEKKPSLPSWQGLLRLFLNGLLGIIILSIYAIPFVLFSFIFIMKLPTGVLDYPLFYFLSLVKNAPVVIGYSATVALVVIGLYTFIYFYIFPIALLQFITTRKFRNAFDFKIILRNAVQRSYFIIWIFIFCIGSLLAFIEINTLFPSSLINVPRWAVQICKFGIFPLLHFVFSVFAFTIFGAIIQYIGNKNKKG